jgi:tetratricopeptide (TPR) repeat protein
MQNKIAVSRSDNAAPRVNPAVAEAYAALQAGQFEIAQRLYNQALRGEPANVDAMLGLAAIAQHESRNDDAQRLYMAILDVEPRHALAQSGLIGLMGRADPQASETRLKQLLAREPSAPLYFNLGNLYAEQGLWAQAQQAYFQAHQLEPRNPDYAYNLAVGLEHVGQPRLAIDFYRKALQLAPTTGAANFDPARIQERITQLAARVN